MIDICNIRKVANGYLANIIDNGVRKEFIAHTLMELTLLVELSAPENAIDYNRGCGLASLEEVRNLAKSGKTIDAIRMLRNSVDQPITLRLAKHIVDIMRDSK